MVGLADVPPEVVEQIVIFADPSDIIAFSQTASLYHAIISNDQRLWQLIYLAQPLDDPRECLDQYGRPTFVSNTFDWRIQFMKIIRVQNVVLKGSFCRPEDRCAILQTLLDLITNIPPTTSLNSGNLSLNLAWVVSLLQNSMYLDTSFTLSPDEDQLRARIHCHFGLTKTDLNLSNQTQSRAYIYDIRNYHRDTHYGPYMLESVDEEEEDELPQEPSTIVNWVHAQAIHHIVSMHVVEDTLEEFMIRYQKGKWKRGEEVFKDFVFIHYPMSLPYCQSVIPPGFDIDVELDWAGVEGLWESNFCYFDHRELITYNKFGIPDSSELDPSYFEKPYFREDLQTLTIEIHVTGSEDDPLHPTRPKLHFSSDDQENQQFRGWVGYDSKDQIRWYFEYGHNAEMAWSSSGVQVGAVRSSFGVVGSWTTINHMRLSPVGPFWFHKINDAIRFHLDDDGDDRVADSVE